MANEIKNAQAEAIEVVKEVEEMAEVINEQAAVVEEKVPALPKFNDVIIPADEEREMLLITATRNKYTAMFWDYITVPAGADPREVIKEVNQNKFVNLVDARNVTRFVEEGKALRGMASTLADFANRYAKTFEIEVTDRVAVVLEAFKEVLQNVEAGVLSGSWGRPEPEVAPEEEVEEAPAGAEEEVDDPFEVAE